ncbi:hypothetical protein EJ377_18175 [Chryseobacterium arthrosphaerae]|uniref:Uncharacterized protein n=1 Tax=Chryseobacterium arthrosphaerae TaxID=651561 RepID=A0A432DTA6_9FLAO|nr:hypothetical protein EJ377_18175 [Chryseobacterium arthrosphaerae]
MKNYHTVNVIEDYNIRNLTQTLQYDQKVNMKKLKGLYSEVRLVDKNVFYQLMLKYGLTVDTDGDGVDDMNDACPTVRESIHIVAVRAFEHSCS